MIDHPQNDPPEEEIVNTTALLADVVRLAESFRAGLIFDMEQAELSYGVIEAMTRPLTSAIQAWERIALDAQAFAQLADGRVKR